MNDEFYSVSVHATAHIIEMQVPEHLDDPQIDRLAESLLTLIDGRPQGRWVIELSRSQYAGSALLGLLVNVRQQVRKTEGKLVLCCPTERLMEILRTCCLEKLFYIAHSRREALGQLGA